RPPRWAAFSHRFEAASSQSAIAGLNCHEASAARALRNAARTTTLGFLSSISSATARREKAPDNQHDKGSNDRAEQPGAFTGVIPADCLPQVGGNEGADDTENSGEDKAGRFVR